jgi:hypothetical protein
MEDIMVLAWRMNCSHSLESEKLAHVGSIWRVRRGVKCMGGFNSQIMQVTNYATFFQPLNSKPA